MTGDSCAGHRHHLPAWLSPSAFFLARCSGSGFQRLAFSSGCHLVLLIHAGTTYYWGDRTCLQKDSRILVVREKGSCW